jgi:hypothetical protein
MSTKLSVMLRMKYSSPMLRPPATTPAAVGDEQLVVHAVIQAAGSRAATPCTCPAMPCRAAAERVEQPHLDVGDRREGAQQLVAADGVQVVDQQPHAHARVCAASRRLRSSRRPVLSLLSW